MFSMFLGGLAAPTLYSMGVFVAEGLFWEGVMMGLNSVYSSFYHTKPIKGVTKRVNSFMFAVYSQVTEHLYNMVSSVELRDLVFLAFILIVLIKMISYINSLKGSRPRRKK